MTAVASRPCGTPSHVFPLLSGVDLNLPFKQGYYPNHLATRLLRDGVVRGLTHRGARTSIAWTIHQGRAPCLSRCLRDTFPSREFSWMEVDADVMISPRPDSMSLLHVAGGWKTPDPIIRLLNSPGYGLSIDIRNAIGQTPLPVLAAVGACDATRARVAATGSGRELKK